MPDNSLKKLIELAKIEGNKFFVLDEKGEPVLVMMSAQEYEKLLVRKIETQMADIEQINREILEAQKRDETQARKSYQEQLRSEVIDSTFSFEAKDPEANLAEEEF